MPLISILGDEDSELVVQALDTLRVLSFTEMLRDYIVDNGAVSSLCSYISQDVNDVSIEILKHSMALMSTLISNRDARSIMYESSVILPILSFLSSENEDVRALWFDGIKELCAFQSFRQ
jgi:hypothetical protein